MSSAIAQQQGSPPDQSDTVGKGVFSNIIEEISTHQEEKDERDLASLTAKLDLDDHQADPFLSSNATTVHPPNEQPDSKAMDENSNSKLAQAITVTEQEEETAEATAEKDQSTAAAPKTENAITENTTSQNQTTTTTTPEDAETTTTSNTANTLTNANQYDESSTPRLSTYIKLHNDMMTSKTALTSHATEQATLYHHASHVARTLLASHDKHGDLPLVMHAQACLVLGCSDEDDCYERMQQALTLIKYAIEEGALGGLEGEAMIRTCEVVMGMWGEEGESEDGEEQGEEGEEDGGDDGLGESDEHGEGKGERVGGEDDHGRNDALP